MDSGHDYMTPKLKSKISETIAATIPKGEKHEISFKKSGVQDTVIVRVVTSAWKKDPAFVRVFRVQRALQERLTEREQQEVFRVNVLSHSDVLRQKIAGSALKALRHKRSISAPVHARTANAALVKAVRKRKSV
jgi:hypothetical protein